MDIDPSFFRSSGLPMPSDFPTASSVRQKASLSSSAIFSSYEVLRAFLDRHEIQLRKKWLKKTRDQRKRILLAVSPDIPAPHRPDFDAFRRSRTLVSPNKKRDCYMWPYINLEDLTRGKSLLLFLNSRGRNAPHMFAHADMDAMHIGHVTGQVMPAFLNGYTMFLDGTTPRDYGRLVSWDEDDDAFDMMFSGRALNPGEGLLILEIQKRTLEFLVDCCYAIFHNIDKASLLADDVPIQPEPPALTQDPNEWPTLAYMAAEAPYRVPAKLDFDQLVAIMAARRAGAEDHIWALREDPGYFFDVVGDESEHRAELLPDADGKRHPHLYDSLFWTRVYASVITDAYGSFTAWDYAFRQAVELVRLQGKYSSAISPTNPLPEEFMKALLLFKRTLQKISYGPINNLKMGLPASPPLRSDFFRQPQVRGSTKMQTTSKQPVGSDFLMWAFHALCDPKQLDLCRLSDLMDELTRMIENDKGEKERLSNWVLGILSDLGLIGVSLQQINLYQPWASSMENEAVNYEDEIGRKFEADLSPLAEIVSLQDTDMLRLRLESPLEGRYTYPSDKRRTEQHVQAMRKAEQNLDSFWETIDVFYRGQTGKSLSQTVKTLRNPDRNPERTPEWVPPVKTPSPDETGSQVPNNLSEPFSDLSLGNQQAESFTIPEQKEKLKTRGTPDASRREIPPPATDEALARPDAQPDLTLGKRAFKVLTTLFHTPNSEGQPGEIPWPDFLHAMAAAGFGPTKLYGSVWQFTPTKLDVERSIQFHEPHPRNKIPFKTARRYGRRLNRAYGWHAGIFTLAE